LLGRIALNRLATQKFYVFLCWGFSAFTIASPSLLATACAVVGHEPWFKVPGTKNAAPGVVKG
jgi:hypothetical protein